MQNVEKTKENNLNFRKSGDVTNFIELNSIANQIEI